MSLHFVPINPDLIEKVKKWHEDEETRKRIAIEQLDKFYSFVNSRLDYWIWGVYDHNELIGELSVEVTGYKTAGISYLVNPSKRNQGYGQNMLKEMVHLKALSFTEIFEAWVDCDNYASIKCLERAGFIKQNYEPDENDMYLYIFNRGMEKVVKNNGRESKGNGTNRND